MTDVISTPRSELARSVGPLNFEVETRGYPHHAPSVAWIANEIGSATLTNRDYGWASAAQLGAFQMRAFIRGFQVSAGASASFQPAHVIGVGQLDTGDFTFTELVVDDPPVGDRIHKLTGAQALVESRLNGLSTLSSGWLDGDGATPTQQAVAAARRLIWILLNHGVERPRLAPTPDGGVEAEWSQADREVSITFEADGSLYGNAVDVTTGEISEPPLTPDDHQAVADFVLGA